MSATTIPARTTIHVFTDGDPRPAPFHPAPGEEARWLALLTHMHQWPGDRVEVVTETSDTAAGVNNGGV